VPPARTGDPNRLKPLQQAVVRPIWELEAESQNGNPVYIGPDRPVLSYTETQGRVTYFQLNG